MTPRQIILIVVAIAVALVAYSVAEPTAILGVTTNGLSNSVDRTIDAQGSPLTGGVSCEELQEGFRCNVATEFKEPADAMSVDVDGGGCWTANQPTGYTGAGNTRHEETVSGCISLIDQVSVVPWE